MKTCSTCGTKFENDAVFCDNCGSKLPEAAAPVVEAAQFCPDCGTKLPADAVFCPDCGASIQPQPAPSPVKTAAPVKPAKPAVDLKKILIPAIIGVLALVLIIVGIKLLSGLGNSGNRYGLILRDNEIQMFDWKKLDEEPTELTRGLLDDGDHYYWAQSFITWRNDGKLLFHPDKMDGYTATLYWRDMTKKNAESEKIDSEVDTYSVTENGKLVTYTKGTSSPYTLYQYNFKDKERIAKDVTYFRVSDDGKILYYINSDGDLYVKLGDDEPERLDREISWIENVSSDFKTVYYVKEDTLYRNNTELEKEKLVSDIYNISVMYATGEAYFLRKSESSVMDFIKNPKDVDEYYTDSLKKTSISDMMEFYELYYFDGEEETLVHSAVLTDYPTNSYSSHVAAFLAVEDPEDALASVTTDMWEYEITEAVREELSNSALWYVATANNIQELAENSAVGVDISSDGKTIYYFDDIDEKDYTGDLYKVVKNGDEYESAEFIESDIDPDSAYFLSSSYVYFMDVKDSHGDLYVDGEMIDYDVYCWGVSQPSNDMLLYYTEWDYEDEEGTLMRRKKGENVEIADAVHTHAVTDDGQILYISDFNLDRDRGDLYVYINAKKKTLIADDVTAILSY